MSFLHKPAPLLVRDLNQMTPLIHEMPALETMNLRSTLNTIVVCRICRGQRTVLVRNRERGTLTSSHCLHCNGTGEMKNYGY